MIVTLSLLGWQLVRFEVSPSPAAKRQHRQRQKQKGKDEH
jgi:hypothetical protein